MSTQSKTYTVINNALIRKCIVLKKSKDDEDKRLESLEVTSDKIEFHKVQHLCFSFRSEMFLYHIN